MTKNEETTLDGLYQQVRPFTHRSNINVIFTHFMDTNQNQERRIVSVNILNGFVDVFLPVMDNMYDMYSAYGTKHEWISVKKGNN